MARDRTASLGPPRVRRAASLLAIVAMALAFGGCDPREWRVCSLGLCGTELDTRAPRAPTELTVTPGDGRVLLDWIESPTEDVVEYRVYRATSAGGPYARVGSDVLFPPFEDPEFFDDEPLANGTAYYYVVTARDGAGNESAHSNEASGVPVDIPPPPRPDPVTLSARSDAPGEIVLSWTESERALEYYVLRATVAGGPYTEIDSTFGLTHTDEGLTSGTPYFYVVIAEDDIGQVSDRSNEASATPARRRNAAGAASARAFRATMTMTRSAPGRVRRTDDAVVERGARAAGRFRGRLPGRRPARALRAFRRGRWHALFDVTVNPDTLAASAQGFAVATRRAGRLCLRFELAVDGTAITGTFRTAGGTGAVRSLTATGSFRQRLGPDRSWTLRGTSRPTGRQGGGLAPGCRRVVRAFGRR